ncbi:fibronectin type III domain-containing protein [Streptomyces sp. NPDC101165]|uniref:fibronectin type III domain-containing protein n=1 Tax=Streptomyces sp. NPDC101165 TaxID=3366119 RepID=UPI0037F4B289
MRLRKLPTKAATRAVAVTVCCSTALLDPSFAMAAGRAPKPAFSADPLATWQTNGIVWSLASVGRVVYVGGTFTSVRPPGAAPGTREVRRHNFAAFDAVTGALLPCAPSFTGGEATVRALKASPDGRVLYVGGSFDHVRSTGVASAVALNTAGCTLRKDFRPAVSATVRAIDTTDRTVYLGGDFDLVDGRSRNHVAALTPAGTLLPFQADIDAPVRALSVVPAHEKLYVGGEFEWVDGQRAHSLAALNPTTGRLAHTYPDWLPPKSAVKSIAHDGTRFYVGAEGTGEGVFDGRIAGWLSDDATVWKDTCLGATQAVLPYKGVLYSASHAHDCTDTPGGFPDRHDRQHLLAQSPDNRTILHWFPDTDEGEGKGVAGVGPRALAVARGILWVGGEFGQVNDRPQQGLTRFGAGPGTVAPKAPALSVSAASPGKVTLRWQASWDRTTAALTYRLYRDGRLVARRTSSSTYWDRPWLSYTDSVRAGTRHRYRIEVTDGTNTSRKSRSLNVTVPTKATARAAGDTRT